MTVSRDHPHEHLWKIPHSSCEAHAYPFNLLDRLMASDEGLIASESRTHYQVLALTPFLLSSSKDPSAVIKKAYHRALLQNHPDKARAPKSTGNLFTVDQITKAYTILSSPGQRAEYDNVLKLSRQSHNHSADAEGSGVGGAAGVHSLFQTGVETVDLDDLQFDGDKGLWYRSCRCGNDRGYSFEEDDLESVSDEGELMVGCQDCSLWLRVHFAVLDDDDDLPEA